MPQITDVLRERAERSTRANGRAYPAPWPVLHNIHQAARNRSGQGRDARGMQDGVRSMIEASEACNSGMLGVTDLLRRFEPGTLLRFIHVLHSLDLAG